MQCNTRLSRPLPVLTLSALALLASCGGGGGSAAPGASGPPAARIQFPPEASLTDADGITVRGAVARPEGVAGLTVAGVPASTTDGWKTWTAEVPLGLGANELEVRMTGPGGAEVGNTDEVVVHREDVVLGDCTSIAVAGPGDSRAWWLDADRSRLVEVDTFTGERSCTPILGGLGSESGPWPYSVLDPVGAIFDDNRNRLYVRDRERIYTVHADTGARKYFSGREWWQEGWVVDMDYDPLSDRFLSLETDADFPFAMMEVYSIDPATRERDLVCSYQADNVNGDILAQSISIFRDGSGSSAVLASWDRLSLLNVQNGARVSQDMDLESVTDIACWNWRVYLLEEDRGIFELNLWNGQYTQVLDFSAAYMQQFGIEEGQRLVAGPGAQQVTFTDDLQDAAFILDLPSGKVELLCRSGNGEGTPLAEATGLVSFAGRRLVLDPDRARILEIHPNGDRSLFSLGGHLGRMEGAAVIDDHLYVANSYPNTIVRLDANGTQSLVIANDLNLTDVRDLAYSDPAEGGDGRLFALCYNKVVRVDLEAGTSFVFSGSGDGRGTDLHSAQEFFLDLRSGFAFVTDAGVEGLHEGALVMVGLHDGWRGLVGGGDVEMGSGADISMPRGIAPSASGDEYLVAAGRRGPGAMTLYRWLDEDFHREEICSESRGRGPMVDEPSAMWRDGENGTLHLTGRYEGAILVVDPKTGDRVMLSR